MRKKIYGRQFKRDFNERKALFKGLMTSLVMHERIETTEEKAKAIQGSVEKLVTKSKKKGTAAKSLLLPYLSEDAVEKMFNEIAPRYTNRNGGYTRIIKLGRRFGDNAKVAIIEWVEKDQKLASPTGGSKIKDNKDKKLELKDEVQQDVKVGIKKEAKKVESTEKVKKSTKKSKVKKEEKK